jgi:hypothetical protein
MQRAACAAVMILDVNRMVTALVTADNQPNHIPH